jgi:hypothetical protein
MRQGTAGKPPGTQNDAIFVLSAGSGRFLFAVVAGLNAEAERRIATRYKSGPASPIASAGWSAPGMRDAR